MVRHDDLMRLLYHRNRDGILPKLDNSTAPVLDSSGMRRKRNLTGRLKAVELIGDTIRLTAQWTEDAHRLIQITVFKDDLSMLTDVLTPFVAGDKSYRASSRDIAATLKAKRADARQRAKDAKAKRGSTGIKIIDLGD
jgi:hypothetical protein